MCPGDPVSLGFCTVTISADTTCAENNFRTAQAADGGPVGVGHCQGSTQGNDLVYAVKPVNGGTLTATLDPNFSGPLIEIREGDCDAGATNLVACNGNCGGQVSVSTLVEGGSTYYVVVDGFSACGGAFNGTFTLTLSLQ